MERATDRERREKLAAAIKCCAGSGETCKECPYHAMKQLIPMFRCVTDGIMQDALLLLGAKPQTPRLLTAEEACSTWGHGYEEIWFHADEEMPECKLLFEIVFINGEFVCADGDHGTIDPDTYNTPYNSRVWLGDAPPTDEQREKTPWKETST